MSKIDLRKKHPHLYNPSAKLATTVEVPPMNFLMVDGFGDPNTTPQFQSAMEALFSLSYTLKFMIKKNTGEDYAVMPAEGLWWIEDMRLFDLERKDLWKWTIMIMQPESITETLVEEARVEVQRKKKDLPSLETVRFELFGEGLSVQIMHNGPFAAEGPTVAKLHDLMAQEGYEANGKHHEIYLSDFRRTAPERLKTIIRQPVRSKTITIRNK